MILPDHEIKRLMRKGTIVKDEVDPVQVQPCSLDLRLGDQVHDFVAGQTKEYDDEITFYPQTNGNFYLCHTQESLNMPYSYAGSLWGRSSIGRKGLQIHNAGWIDPGFRGDVVLEVSNFTSEPITIPVGTRVCQVVFHELSERAEVPYDYRNSKYVGQQGPQTSRLDREL